MQMQLTKHSLLRLNQRGISHAMAELVYAYGITCGDKVILNQKAAMARRIEALAEKAALSKCQDEGVRDLAGAMHRMAEIENEIRNLMKLIDKKGCVLVMVGNILLTAYGMH